MNIVLLSGGSGTRLWPLSNGVRSKQFLKIFRTDDGEHESMVQRMHRMIKKVVPDARILIATSETQVGSITDQLGDDINISLEPYRRDTFPAIALAISYLHDIIGVSLDEGVVVCPVDPLVDEGYFLTIERMFDILGSNNLTLMGIKPTYPSEKYGYIIPKDDKIIFREKPKFEEAQEYINQGALWNGGVFAFRIGYLLEKCYELCGMNSYDDLFKNYSLLPKISFDYAIVENESNIGVVKYSGEWKDLGTWNTFTEAIQDDVGGNAILGENCENVHIINELSIPIVALGLKNIIIAASPDGILVSDKQASSFLKKYVPNNRPMFEKRIWGEYRILDYQTYENNVKSLTEELVILPNKNTDYQKHNYRDEMWTFVNGSGLLAVDGVVKSVNSGDSIRITKGQKYAVKAIKKLHIIVVQIGYELAEEDVERFVFNWSSFIEN